MPLQFLHIVSSFISEPDVDSWEPPRSVLLHISVFFKNSSSQNYSGCQVIGRGDGLLWHFWKTGKIYIPRQMILPVFAGRMHVFHLRQGLIICFLLLGSAPWKRNHFSKAPYYFIPSHLLWSFWLWNKNNPSFQIQFLTYIWQIWPHKVSWCCSLTKEWPRSELWRQLLASIFSAGNVLVIAEWAQALVCSHKLRLLSGSKLLQVQSRVWKGANVQVASVFLLRVA